MSAASDTYLHGHHDSVLRSHRWRTAENSAGYLLPRLAPTARVLDIGCGPGTITADLAARVPDGDVVGIDAAGDVLAMARAEADRRGQANVRFEVGDAYELGFEDETFDVVHAHQVMQHLSDPVAALTEMRRVCRPGGLIAARDGDYGGMFWFPGDPELTEWQTLYRNVARAASPTRDGTCCPGPGRPASRRSRRRPARGATPDRRTGRGGGLLGPNGSPTRRSGTGPWNMAWRPGRTWSAWPGRGAAGGPARTAGS
jgi:SAM-dependent methyltransferase